MLPHIFYTFNFVFMVFISIIRLIISLGMILIFYFNHQFHSLNNLLLCNTAFAAILYSDVSLVFTTIGFFPPIFVDFTLITSVSALLRFVIRDLNTRSVDYCLTAFANRRLVFYYSFLCSFIKNGFMYEKESFSCVISSQM